MENALLLQFAEKWITIFAKGARSLECFKRLTFSLYKIYSCNLLFMYVLYWRLDDKLLLHFNLKVNKSQFKEFMEDFFKKLFAFNTFLCKMFHPLR